MDGIIVIHLRLVGGNYFLSSSMISIGSTLGAVQLHYLGFIHLGRALIFQQAATLWATGLCGIFTSARVGFA